MGKEWFSNKSSVKRGKFAAKDEEHEATPSGCMCAVLQLFDLNHFQLALPHQQPSFKPDAFLEEPTIRKGLEAPRNSLELVEPPREDTDLNIPVGIRIKTRIETKSPRESTSECSSSSPSTKTPSLVARLMGLDLLPEGGSPSSLPPSTRHSTGSNLSVKSRLHHQEAPNRHEDRARHLLEIKSKKSSGTRSLPETPRVSSDRRSDLDHRFSLQFNKENTGEVFDLSAYIAKKVARRREAWQEEENRNPGHYARQIVKQVRERVSRKVGADITNTIKNREQQAKDKHEHVVLLRPRKPSRVLTSASDEFSPTKQSTPSSSSPRTSSTTLPNKTQTSKSPKFSSFVVPSADANKIPLKPKPNVQPPQQQSIQQEKPVHKCEKAAGERYTQRLKKPPQASDAAIRNKREDPFLRSPSKYKANNLTDKMCKKIPLSNELLNNNVQTLLPVKKQIHALPPPAIKLIDHKQSQAYDNYGASTLELSKQISSCSSQSYKCNSGDEVEYHQSIQRILRRTGIVDASTPVSLAKWYSPTHPLDPAIFHHIELLHHTNSTIFNAKNPKLLNKRCNRMLIFQLVDELLAEILKPYIDFKPWVGVVPVPQRCQIQGSELIETLFWRIKTFPSANCQVLEDIDALIDKELGESKPRRSSNAAASQEEEEEWEIIVSEIERGIVESLVHEMVIQVFGCGTAWIFSLTL